MIIKTNIAQNIGSKMLKNVTDYTFKILSWNFNKRESISIGRFYLLLTQSSCHKYLKF